MTSAAGDNYFCPSNYPVRRYRIDYRPASRATEAEKDGRKDTTDVSRHDRDERSVVAEVAVRPLAAGDQTGALVVHPGPDPVDGVWEDEIEPLL